MSSVFPCTQINTSVTFVKGLFRGTQRPIVIKPQLMKIYVIKAFSGVFQYCWAEKNYLFLFPSKTHKKFPSQEDKIGWFPSQLQSEQPASRRTTIFFIVRQNERGGRAVGENHLTFKSFLAKLYFKYSETSLIPR